MSTSHLSHADVLRQFRSDLVAEGYLHDGDTVGTDDETLLRFLRARKFDLQQSKKMFKDCQDWRRTVEGVGIDELYRRIDPFDPMGSARGTRIYGASALGRAADGGSPSGVAVIGHLFARVGAFRVWEPRLRFVPVVVSLVSRLGA